MRITKGFAGLMLGGVLALPAQAQADKIKADSGAFRLTIQENEIGTDTFQIDAEGNSKYEIKVNAGGQKLTLQTTVKAKAGRLIEVATDGGPVGKFTLTLNGKKAKLVASGGGKTQTRDMTVPEKLYPFSNYGPHILTHLIAAYDRKAGGTQKFDLLLTDGAGVTIPCKLTAKGSKPMQVKGKPVAVARYTLAVAGAGGDIEIELYADTDHRMLMWHVPAQKYRAVREGYADLAQSEEPTDPLLSKPTYAVKRETVPILLRDGVKTVADVYRPDAEGQFPVILHRTPYNRKNAMEAGFYAKRGYVFVAQDVRGKFDSGGKWEPFVNEARDGHDSVTWCAQQPWSNGKVGMIGASYAGFVQWAAAREGSPHLKCLIPIVSPPDPFFNIPYAYGAFFLYPSAWWAAIVDGKGMKPPKTLTNLDGFRALPLNTVDKKLFGKTVPFFQTWLKHSTNDAYWDQVNFLERMKSFAPLPALHVSGWFDGDGIGTKLNYATMVAAGQKNQKLVYGPWPHAVNSVTRIGELNFGPQSVKDLETLYLRWFDRWLKERDNGVDKEPPVEAFLMGRNEWKQFSAWPPQETQIQKWYLHSGGRANTSGGNGKLALEPPSADAPPDRFTYDPAKPYIPGPFLADLKRRQENSTLNVSADLKNPGLLVYTSETLPNDVTVAGPISLKLFAATSAKDTDWYAQLMDVHPNGKSFSLCAGIIRARFRNSFTKPALLKPNQIAAYAIDLWALGHVFKKGHKIRLMITSSCFPIYDRNLNTGEDIATGKRMVVARQTVYHDYLRPSHLLLPVLP
jgi:putative CocE/NonD family hydrolase